MPTLHAEAAPMRVPAATSHRRCHACAVAGGGKGGMAAGQLASAGPPMIAMGRRPVPVVAAIWSSRARWLAAGPGQQFPVAPVLDGWRAGCCCPGHAIRGGRWRPRPVPAPGPGSSGVPRHPGRQPEQERPHLGRLHHLQLPAVPIGHLQGRISSWRSLTAVIHALTAARRRAVKFASAMVDQDRDALPIAAFKIAAARCRYAGSGRCRPGQHPPASRRAGRRTLQQAHSGSVETGRRRIHGRKGHQGGRP